jgi:hypothetical protein
MASSGYEKGMTLDEKWQADLKRRPQPQRKQISQPLAGEAVTLHDNIHLRESGSGQRYHHGC